MGETSLSAQQVQHLVQQMGCHYKVGGGVHGACGGAVCWQLWRRVLLMAVLSGGLVVLWLQARHPNMSRPPTHTHALDRKKSCNTPAHCTRAGQQVPPAPNSCNHVATDLCVQLTGKPAPPWVRVSDRGGGGGPPDWCWRVPQHPSRTCMRQLPAHTRGRLALHWLPSLPCCCWCVSADQPAGRACCHAALPYTWVVGSAAADTLSRARHRANRWGSCTQQQQRSERLGSGARLRAEARLSHVLKS
jgi:hypothetical protein